MMLAALHIPRVAPIGRDAPLVSATVQQCLPGGGAEGGSATFAGQMVALPGAFQMAMRVDLEVHDASESGFHRLSAPGLGVWHRSEPSVKVFRYLAQVTSLAAPAGYRALITYRWLDVGGHVMRHAVRHTPVCRQPAPASGAHGEAHAGRAAA
ncbi:MAG: hypothetical protein KGJ43_00500 [Acidobacteriota bacterium]|nr:hypothetical protein [Acidobacteriota bacterium]